METYKHIRRFEKNKHQKNFNVMDLIHESRKEEKRQKRKTQFLALITVTLLIISGYIIAL